MGLKEIEERWKPYYKIDHWEIRDIQWLISRVKELEEIVTLAVESQGWDGNNPDDERWTEFYKKARMQVTTYHNAFQDWEKKVERLREAIKKHKSNPFCVDGYWRDFDRELYKALGEE